MPTADELGLSASDSTVSLAGFQPSEGIPVTEHQAEWLGLATLADHYGFAMP